MNINKVIRLILVIFLLVGGSFYHLYNLPKSKSYEITVLDKWETESCSKRNCTEKYIIKYQVRETAYISEMDVLKRDYINFNTGSVANYTLSRKESNNVSTASFIMEFLCFAIICFFLLFLVFLFIIYFILILNSIINWEFDIDDFKFWNWRF